MKRRTVNIKSKARQPRLMGSTVPKPHDGIELIDLWRAPFTWQPGEQSQIVTVTYYPSYAPLCGIKCKVRAIHCPDGTTALRCPACGEECFDLNECKRGFLTCGDCIRWLKPEHKQEKKAA